MAGRDHHQPTQARVDSTFSAADLEPSVEKWLAGTRSQFDGSCMQERFATGQKFPHYTAG